MSSYVIRKNLEEKAKKLEDAIKGLEDLRVRDSEDYNLVKIKLETDVQVLEQQLQQVGSKIEPFPFIVYNG